jgi:acetyl-CoA carboxylase biotin carboxyl carrier protein
MAVDVMMWEMLNHGDRRLPLGAHDYDRAEALKALLEQVRCNAVQLLTDIGPTPRNLRVRAGDILVEIEWGDVAGPVQPAADAPPAAPAASPGPVAEYLTAPTVGVFYHAPGPDADPFVRVGDTLRPGQQVGIIESMKLMIPVEADRAGEVIAVLKGNGETVEYGERLLALAAGDA